MTTIIDRHRSGIEALCRTYQVKRLDVFGSAIREDFDPVRSDVDFLVEFEPEPDLDTFHAYMDLGVSCRACWGVQSTWSCRPECATATSRRRSRPPASPWMPRDPRALLADVLDLGSAEDHRVDRIVNEDPGA